jgi:hypothetical protein
MLIASEAIFGAIIVGLFLNSLSRKVAQRADARNS